MNNIETLSERIQRRILKKSNYEFINDEPYNLNLDDPVILYNSGAQWKIVSLDISLSYPIIYDKYSYDDEQYDVSVIVCPLTLLCVMLKGVFTFLNFIDNKMILKENDNIIPIDFNQKINSNMVIQDNKRIEVKIMTLKNAIINAPDVLYMKCNKNIKPIIDKLYYSNKQLYNGEQISESIFHPKTLVYIVKFSSNTTLEEKFVILMGNKANSNTVTGYDLIDSGLNSHLMKFRAKIIKKNGYIMPILWYYAKKIYPNAKIVHLHD